MFLETFSKLVDGPVLFYITHDSRTDGFQHARMLLIFGSLAVSFLPLAIQNGYSVYDGEKKLDCG